MTRVLAHATLVALLSFASPGPTHAAGELHHSVRLDAEFGSPLGSAYGTLGGNEPGGSLWGAVAVYYGLSPYPRFQLDLGLGLRRTPSAATQLEVHATPRLSLRGGALRWLPGIDLSAGPSFDGTGAIVVVLLRIEPLALEIALAGAVGFFFAAGVEVGLSGAYCRAGCSSPWGNGYNTYAQFSNAGDVAGKLAAYSRMGLTYRF